MGTFLSVTFLTRHHEGRWYEQGDTLMQIPLLRKKVSVQKWPHRGTSTNTQPTNLHPTGTAAKYSQSFQWYSSVRHTAKLEPGHFASWPCSWSTRIDGRGSQHRRWRQTKRMPEDLES